MKTFGARLGMTAWVVFSGALAILIWGFIVPQIPFTDAFWEEARFRPLWSENGTDVAGFVMSSRLTYKPEVTCTVTSVHKTINGTEATDVFVDIVLPPTWPSFLIDRVRGGCAVFMSNEMGDMQAVIKRLIEEELEKAARKPPGRSFYCSVTDR